MTGIGDSLPPIDQALLPASVRNGTKEQKQQYSAALEFERTLVSQMTESMMKTASIGGDDDSGSAATKIMKESIPGHLADAIMGAGGLGIAQQLSSSWTGEAKTTSLSAQPSPSQPGQGGLSA